jgi:hypothetical protein
MKKRHISAKGYPPLRATQNANDKSIFGQRNSTDLLSVQSILNEEVNQQLNYKTESLGDSSPLCSMYTNKE